MTDYTDNRDELAEDLALHRLTLLDRQIENLIEPVDPLDFLVPRCPCPTKMARRCSIIVLDDFVSTTGRTITAVSTDDFAYALGLFDAISIHAIVDQANLATSLSVQIEHSADGETWLPKATSPEVPATALNVGQTTMLPIGYDDGSIPTLAFVRLKLAWTGGLNAHVKVTVTISDSRIRELEEPVLQLLDRLSAATSA